MGKNRKKRLIRLQDFLKQTSIEIVGGLGLGGGIRTMYRQLSVLNTEDRALKRSDLWIKDGIVKDTLLARNRLTKSTANIPLRSLTPSLRRQSGVDVLDVTEKSDFLLTASYPEMEAFLENRKLIQRFENNKSTWQAYARRRQGKVFIGRKFDLSAPGTRLVCFYSSIPLVPGEFWLLSNLNFDYGQVLCLWFNSTPNLIQMFLNRTETRGAWMKTDVRTLKECFVIDPRALEREEKTELLEVFRSISNSQFPSISEQLRTIFPARKTMDEAVLKIVGFGEDEVRDLLDYLYPALANEIKKLKTMMEG